jgi:cupin superfamily acireductone dioxygenase involved in methionine salvage
LCAQECRLKYDAGHHGGENELNFGVHGEGLFWFVSIDKS